MIRKYCLIVCSAVLVLLSSCNGGEVQKANPLLGVWEVYDAEFLYDERNYIIVDDANSKVTAIRIYTSDSLVFDLCVRQDKDFREFIPTSQMNYSFLKNADSSVLYSEGGYKCQLTIMCDTAICLKKTGTVYYLRRTDAFDDDIDNLLPKLYSWVDWQHSNNVNYTFYNSYKITQHEKEQKVTIDIILLVLGLVLFIVIGLGVYIVITKRQKSMMKQQLKRLQDEKKHVTEEQARAFSVAEQVFWKSEFYVDFCSRIERDHAFDEAYWVEMEHQVNVAFPRFIPNLRALVKLSQVEYRTCLLLKLKVAPSVIAPIVHREATTISSIRSRLYKKVFGKKGTSQQWDEFIMSI